MLCIVERAVCWDIANDCYFFIRIIIYAIVMHIINQKEKSTEAKANENTLLIVITSHS